MTDAIHFLPTHPKVCKLVVTQATCLFETETLNKSIFEKSQKTAEFFGQNI